MTTRQMPTEIPRQLNIRVITRAPTATAADYELESEQLQDKLWQQQQQDGRVLQ